MDDKEAVQKCAILFGGRITGKRVHPVAVSDITDKGSDDVLMIVNLPDEWAVIRQPGDKR